MRRQPREPGKEELLGRLVTVVASSDPGLVGVSGEVLDETMKTLVVRTGDGRRLVVPKVAVTLRFALDGTDVVLEGRTIVFRPEDRTKKARTGLRS